MTIPKGTSVIAIEYANSEQLDSYKVIFNSNNISYFINFSSETSVHSTVAGYKVDGVQINLPITISANNWEQLKLHFDQFILMELLISSELIEELPVNDADLIILEIFRYGVHKRKLYNKTTIQNTKFGTQIPEVEKVLYEAINNEL